MTELLCFEASDDTELLVEVSGALDDDYIRAASPGELFGKASVRLDDALKTIRTAGNAVLAQVRSLEALPAEVTVEFGIKLTGKVGAVLASSSGEAQLLVKLTWKSDS